ncbi:glycosyl transferase group 1 [Candidatus Vecturithrix granuli]|uniref:Glycosyl transferase group 1 n=1 Tax=Vecturithrix granuli TaxID=1499967 RepID=A0A081BXV1_VECG1|nr:glycosyl transferase group 1 [Candidatus Vecturithrix granuli]
MMRIGFICSEYPPDRAGGIGSFTYDLAHKLAEHGHQIWVIGLSDRDARENDGPIHIRRIRRAARQQHTYLEAFRDRWRLSRVARQIANQQALDVIEAPEYNGEAAFFHFPKRTRCKLLTRYHGGCTSYAAMKGMNGSRLSRYFEGRTIKSADYRISVSRFIEEYTRKSFGKEGRADITIPNFVDTEIFAPVPGMVRDPHLILFLGKVSVNKGAPQLFAALPEIFRQNESAWVELIGPDSYDGPGGTSLLSHLMGQLDSRWRQRIVYRGAVKREEVQTLYRQAGCCVFPSIAESFCIAAIEAMACAAAVVVSPIIADGEAVIDGESGYICDPQDRQLLSQRMLWLLEHQESARQLGLRARERVIERFSLPTVVRQNEEFYQKCVLQEQIR